jgi:CRP/FNR family transcriptional regulator
MESTVDVSLPGVLPQGLTAKSTAQDGKRQCCQGCSLRNLCLPTGLKEEEMATLDTIIGRRRRVPRDGYLYRMEDPFRSLYAVKVGHFKTQRVDEHGNRQITGFQMPGELLGMDAIARGSHHCDSVALEDSEVCEIPFERLEQLFVDMPALLRHFHRLMSQEITREQGLMVLLGNMHAAQRVANFFINLSSRYEARGYSPTTFQLRMKREEIADYLGLTIESISRLISKLQKAEYLEIDNRKVTILDLPALKELAASSMLMR